jgi:hypothetical protein
MPPLRIAQTVIVGRAVILSQPMDDLPRAETFDTKSQQKRFGWLMYGTEQDVDEIHGGCGFSKRLLYTISQITLLATILQHNPSSRLDSVGVKILRELRRMKQWSRESRKVNPAGSDESPTSMTNIRIRPSDYRITESAEMIEVTAEAWRFATIAYLQCRLLR